MPDALPIIGMTGSRTITDREQVWRWLDKAWGKFGPFRLAHGCQPKGADGHAEAWCLERGVEQVRFPPVRWRRAELMARNTQIAEASERIIAFWDGESTGTQDTMRKAKRLGKPVYDVLAREQGREPWR